MAMPPLMSRPSSPNGWAGSTVNGWGGAAPANDVWGASSNAGWGHNAAPAQGWGQASNTAAAGWDNTSNNAAAGWGSTAADGWTGGGGESAGERWGTGGQAPVSASIPPPPGATFLGNPNHIGSWGNQAPQTSAENLWAGHTPGEHSPNRTISR